MEFFAASEIIFKNIIKAIQPLVGTEQAAAITGTGADNSPTKYIDKIAEDIAIRIISEENLCKLIISEEAGKVMAGGQKGVIFLDPVDGTYNAIMDIPFYALSIAYGENGIIMKGFVGNLANGDIFTSEKGKGSCLNGRLINSSKVDALNTSCMSVYCKNFQHDRVVNLIRIIRRFRQFGASALELCYTGAGKTDGFIDLRQTLRATDIAAGMLILEEAGGIVSDMSGNRILLTDDVYVGNCLIGTNGILHPKVIDYFR